MVRFYRARQWNGFYCVDDFIRDGEHDAITCSGVRKVGKVSRIHITDETIRTELFEVHWSEVPASWQESFRGYLWRSRSRL